MGINPEGEQRRPQWILDLGTDRPDPTGTLR
jgi:hypothetical protein